MDSNWAFIDQSVKLIAEQISKQEKQAYDELYALVQNKIAHKEDLNQPMPDVLAQKTLLHQACNGGDTYLPITQLLISRGANPNVFDWHKSAPLHNAVDTNAFETVKLLLSSEAHSDPSDTLFGTPLQSICRRANDILHDEGEAQNRVKIATLLSKYHADPNGKYEFKDSCLHQIIAIPRKSLNGTDSLKYSNKALFFSQRKALIRALLSYGASLNAKDSKDQTPIGKAYESTDLQNRPYFTELANYALFFSNHIRTRLLSILGHSGTHIKHETPFKALPKDIVNIIVEFAHSAYKSPLITKTQVIEKK